MLLVSTVEGCRWKMQKSSSASVGAMYNAGYYTDLVFNVEIDGRIP